MSAVPRVLAVVAVALSVFTTPLLADAPPPRPPLPPSGERLPGVALAEGITQITGVAISPLLGVCGVGAWQYFTAAPEARSSLPWFCHPVAWGIGFGILALVLVKDLSGAALPSVLKKPLDVLELFEDKISALVASAALVPFLNQQVAETFAAPSSSVAGDVLSPASLAMIDPVFATSPGWLLALLIPLSLAAFFAVWLSSHALSVLLLFSPFGILDLILKTARVLFLAGLVVLSAVAPVLAGILCGLLILVALWFAPRAFRLSVFGTIMSVDLLKSLLRSSDRHPRTRGFLVRGGGRLAKLSFGTLEKAEGGGLRFASRFLLVGPTRRLTLPGPERLELERGFLYPSLRLRGTEGKKAVVLVHLLPRHRQDLAHVAATFEIGPVLDAPVLRGAKAAVRRIGQLFAPPPVAIETGEGT